MRSKRTAAILLFVVMGTGLGACRSGGGANSATVGDFCRVLEQEHARLASLTGSKALVERAATIVAKLERASPPEIKDDVQLLADAYRKVVSGDFLALAPKAARLQDAAQHVTTYAKDKCNFDVTAR